MTSPTWKNIICQLAVGIKNLMIVCDSAWCQSNELIKCAKQQHGVGSCYDTGNY